MKRTNALFTAALASLLLFSGCEKEITIELPEADAKLVVEGRIEQDGPPLVLLTRAQGYFEPTDLNTLNSLYVHDATVTVNDGTNTYTLFEICASQLPDSLIPLVTELTGISEAELALIDVCMYTSLDANSWGEIGKTYTLSIDADDDHVEAVTTINTPVPLDSLWFNLWGANDTLGFIWAKMTDPAGPGNSYRWMAKRINDYADGTQKDGSFIPATGSAFDDQFFDGLAFEFAADRGTAPYSNAEDDNNEERGFFKQGDTVVVKFSAIDNLPMDFFRAVETQQFSNGNPFAAPTTIPSNIEGGLGIWVGYGVFIDTVACYE